MVHEWAPASASSVLTRWQRQELVVSAGEGVWFNLVVDPDGPENRLFEAIGRMFPAVVVIGATVLHDAGWTTQVPQRQTVAVPPRRSTPNPDRVEVCPRPRVWFRKVEPFLRRNVYAVPSLTPAAALADALTHKPGWRPDPDDIGLESMKDVRDFQAAFRAIKKQRDIWPAEWKRYVSGLTASGYFN